MYHPVASVAERYKILGGIVSQQAPWAEVMNVEIVRDPAALTAPPISLEHLFAQMMIGVWSQPNPRPLGSQRSHEATRTSARNSALSG